MMMTGWDSFPPCAKIRILLLDCTVISFSTSPWRGQPEKWVFASCSKSWLWAGQWEVTDGFGDFRSEIVLTLETLYWNPQCADSVFLCIQLSVFKGCTECMDIVDDKSNIHREHWRRKLHFHLWIFFYFCCKWQKWSKAWFWDFAGTRLASIRSGTMYSVYLHAQPLCRGPATDRIWRLRMLMLLTGAAKGANRNTPLSPVCHVLIYRAQEWIFLFVDFLNAWKVIHSFIHLLVAQNDLWFLLIQFVWMWDL